MSNTPLNPGAVEIAAKVVLRAQGFEPGNSPRADRQHAQNLTAQTVRTYLAALSAPAVVEAFNPQALNIKGWTCGCEPGNYDSCDECQSACNELASFLHGVVSGQLTDLGLQGS